MILISFGIKTEAQEFYKDKGEFVIVNMGINGLVGGIGALINKGNREKPLKVFLKGFGQGCLGGAFQVAGKELTFQITAKQNLTYAWPARITNAVGNSITQNAISNINFWERWHFNLGHFRLDYDVKDREFKARLFPSSIYGTIVTASQGKFNLKNTLQTGILIFESDGRVRALGGEGIGVGAVTSIAVDKNIVGQEYYKLMAHEVVHILQYENMVWINPLLNRIDRKLKKNSTFYNKASKYVYLDFNGLTILGLYMTQINKPWECRFIEREADHYSKRINLAMCN